METKATFADGFLSQLRATGPCVMGIVNITPNSFSDGGMFTSSSGGINHAAATKHALRLVDEGAKIIDVGGEASSFFRTGVVPTSPEEQIRRVVPVIKTLAGELKGKDVLLSVDTRSALVARAAVEAGAQMINDVSAGEFDPRMLVTCAQIKVPIVLMHMRDEPPETKPAAFADVVGEVLGYLLQRVKWAEAAGVKRERILIDPGIGFGKTAGDNWKLIAGIGRFVETGMLVVLGVSRKRFLTLTDTSRWPAPVATPSRLEMDARDVPTAIVTALAANKGVQIHRVHNAGVNARALVMNDLMNPKEHA